MLGMSSADSDQGTFKPTRESLAAYRIPGWSRDAKFGIWAHWGPQSAAEAGDWYALQMYIQGHEQYEYHVKHYGHPSKFSFNDCGSNLEGRQVRP
jgi:alpha-L-fucosidase